MSFEQLSFQLGESLQIDQSPPEGTQGGTICSSLLVYNNTNRAVSLSNDNHLSKGSRANPPRENNIAPVKDYKIWLQKDRRAYHRILSGYKLAQYNRYHLRFLTLTTSKEASWRNLKEDTNTLIKRIRRRYRAFEYFRVRTNEGNGVVHLIFRGSYLPRSWVKAQWEDIHKSWNVDIRECQRYHQKYIVNQYICDQQGYTRYSMSGVWLPSGALAVWKGFCHWYPKDKIELWDAFLHKWVVDQQQQRLFADDGGAYG